MSIELIVKVNFIFVFDLSGLFKSTLTLNRDRVWGLFFREYLLLNDAVMDELSFLIQNHKYKIQ